KKRDRPHHHKGSFSSRIYDCRIPRSFEKPPKLETYDGITDFDEHVEHIATVLDCHGARGAVKCKMFVHALKV
ncbi:hypothetical protein A2U01_0065208, partial [Trifolium medium]|nr:hypothetical protein [Trifolium medium]